MALTPAQVSQELLRQGRRVTPRRLRIWRDLGLLPKLIRRRRSQGRGGTIEQWEDDGVLERAALIHDLLGVDTQTATALWSLWLLGHQINVEQVRTIWLDRLCRLQKSGEEKIERSADRSDGLGILGNAVRGQVARNLGLNRGELADVAPLMAAIPFGAVSPGAKTQRNSRPYGTLADKEVDADDLADLLATLCTKLGLPVPSETAALVTAPLLDVLVPGLSLEASRKSLSDAATSDLVEAQQVWQKLRRVIAQIAPTFFAQIAPGGRVRNELVFGISLGRIAVPFLLQNPQDRRAIARFLALPEVTELSERILDILQSLANQELSPALDPLSFTTLAAQAGVIFRGTMIGEFVKRTLCVVDGNSE